MKIIKTDYRLFTPNIGIFLLVFLLSSFYLNKELFGIKLAKAAEERTKSVVEYNPTYFKISYPNGDVPKEYGVCTDVIIRSYRSLDIDLQKRVHEDMQVHFSLYPEIWGLTTTDKNIDHRRVANLMVYFTRKGEVKSITSHSQDYKPGDIVCWNLGDGKSFYGVTHIGIVSSQKSEDGLRYKIVHNIGAGPQLEDCLFNYTIIGHYSYH